MKVGLLDGRLRDRPRPSQVSEVVVFGRTPAKLQAFAEKFGYATTTDLSRIYDDPAIDRSSLRPVA